MLGDRVYGLLKELKNAWDPQHIFNPGKITDTPNMRGNLRYKQGETRDIKTIFDFSDRMGIVRATESCNGSGDCRKLHTAGGTMCPSYMATRDEKNVTRSRANILREFLANSTKNNPFDHIEIYEALDLCLSCKACKSECPSSVDVAKLKAEFLQHWHDANGIPLRSRMVANITKINRLGSMVPGITNFFLTNKFSSGILKKVVGFAPERSMPLLSKISLQSWINKNLDKANTDSEKRQVVLFVDEFTNYNDSHIGIITIRLLTKLGYKVSVLKHVESGRTYLSKGFLRNAKKIAIKNVGVFSKIISENNPLLGIEPSAILAFRDEYPDLVGGELKKKALELARNTFMLDEFLARESEDGFINSALFTEETRNVIFHGHCQQKAIASTNSLVKMLAIPKNYSVNEIPSGCCGMAGSFGFEKEHYDVSMKIGELVLFPEVRNAQKNTIVVASGTSCRHQIFDGTGRKALHPVEVLFDALVK
jgi:Fe-S oxidoreductase